MESEKIDLKNINILFVKNVIIQQILQVLGLHTLKLKNILILYLY